MSDEALGRVQAIVARIAGAERAPADAGPDTPLGEDGYWLDSVDVLEVILACEHEFAIRLDQEPDLTAEALATVRSLAALIEQRRT